MFFYYTPTKYCGYLWGKLVDKPNSERAAFVSPYLNRRLRSVEEVMKARQRQEMVIEQGELEAHGSGQGEGEVRLRLVYSRHEEAPALSPV